MVNLRLTLDTVFPLKRKVKKNQKALTLFLSLLMGYTKAVITQQHEKLLLDPVVLANYNPISNLLVMLKKKS